MVITYQRTMIATICFFLPTVCWIFCTATCSLRYCKLTACAIPSGINVWLPKAKYLFLFHDWMIYFVTKHILFHKFIVPSFIQISNLELYHADGDLDVRCNICSEKINSDKQSHSKATIQFYMKHLFNFTIGILLLSVISVSFIQLPVKTISIVNRYCKLTHNKSSRAGHCFATGLYFFFLVSGFILYFFTQKAKWTNEHSLH